MCVSESCMGISFIGRQWKDAAEVHSYWCTLSQWLWNGRVRVQTLQAVHELNLSWIFNKDVNYHHSFNQGIVDEVVDDRAEYELLCTQNIQKNKEFICHHQLVQQYPDTNYSLFSSFFFFSKWMQLDDDDVIVVANSWWYKGHTTRPYVVTKDYKVQNDTPNDVAIVTLLPPPAPRPPCIYNPHHRTEWINHSTYMVKGQCTQQLILHAWSPGCGILRLSNL